MKFIVTVDKERCKGCGLCIGVCASSTLKMTELMNRKGYRYPLVSATNICKGCRQCTEICPDAAIELEGEEER